MTPEGRSTEAGWSPERKPWGRGDVLAVAIWTVALAAFFRKAVTLREALFYFDITELNLPYREFLAEQIRSGRFAKWHPGIFNGFPIYAESQAGYWHPLKYLLYPWLDTWKAFNLDTIGSIWLAGLATYGWLRRHVGPAGALAGASLFGLSGFAWAHLIHTSMTNALISVPLAFWGLETAWDGGRARGLGLGALALACQVFAGHLQDTIMTAGALGVWTLYRAASAPSRRASLRALAFFAILGALAASVAAVQLLPSKDLLDRSPRVGGLTWEQITYGSWSPELLPTLVLREAYGTLPKDTDWADGYYPYHEMNAYMGLIGMALAVVGLGARRDRWVGSWVVLLGLGCLLMLGRYSALFDYMNLVPIVGSSRIPVRYHLWVSLAVASLASVGVDRLARPGRVKLGPALGFGGFLVMASLAIMARDYWPVATEDRLWSNPEYREHFRWLGRELAFATARTAVLVGLAWALAASASKETRPGRRKWLAAGLPILILADLLGSHWWDVPTVDPSYWTVPPESVARISADPGTIRVFGIARKSAAEPGFASHPVDFFEGRDPLGWTLPAYWGLRSSMGHTPMYPRRVLTFHDHAEATPARFDVEGVTQILTGQPISGFKGPIEKAGAAYIHRNPGAQPRARLMGHPAYVADEADAARAIDQLGAAIRDRLIVEDPTRPLPESAEVEGTAKIVVEEPERVEVEVDARTPAYLVLADTFDPGWSATVDGKPVPIRPAISAFRAVFVEPGNRRIIFTYEPTGFRAGLALTVVGLVLVVCCLAWPRPVAEPDPSHVPLAWPRAWPWAFGLLLLGLVLASAVKFGPGEIKVHPRWEGSFHKFTWAAGIEAIQPMSKMLGR